MLQKFFLYIALFLSGGITLLFAETAIIAHRGASGLAPENTLASFAKAIELGADYFELDVQISSDDSLMLMHDDTIDRTTTGAGTIGSQTYSQLRILDAGSWFAAQFSGEKIPTLSEALELALAAPYRVGVVIEIKTTASGIEEKVLAEVTKRNMQDRVIVSSFNFNQIAKCKQLDASIPVQLFGTIAQTQINQVAAIGGEWVGTSGAISKALLDSTHAKKMFMNKWTVNSAAEMLPLVNLGVDAITTNFPDVARSLLDNTPPTDVVLLEPLVDASRITLTWQPAMDEESGIAGYEIYRDSTAHAVTLFKAVQDTTSYVDVTYTESKRFFYRIKAKNVAGMLSQNFSNEVNAVTEQDLQSPQIKRVHAYGRPDHLLVAFDERLEKSSAETAAHYQISSGIAVLDARLALDRQSVLLTVTPLNENTLYAITVANVFDLAIVPNPILAAQTDFRFIPFLANTVASWDLDEGAGSVISDYSGNNNQGALMNGLGWGPGQKGNGLIFDGMDDYASVPTSPSLDINGAAVSISLWAWLERMPNELPGSYGPLYDSDTDNYVLYEDKGTNELRFKVTTDKSAERPGIPAAWLRTGQWLHIVGVYDGATAVVYLNGQARDSHNLTGTVRPKQRATIGASAGSYFKGAIDDIHIFNRALTEEEIQFLYTGRKSPTVVTHSLSAPDQFRLEQNFPNPFNPTTTIPYQVSERGWVRLSVYDLLGREVVVLIDENQDAGSYAVAWNGRNQQGSAVSSGVYFYKLLSDRNATTRKMILAR